jgi:acyl transferase domain-containing protein
VAACLAGVFSLEDGLKLAAARGRLTQGFPEDGAMTAVSAGLKKAAPELSEYRKEIAVAAINSPNHAPHSSLVEPTMQEFEQLTRNLKFETPRLRMISNVTGEAVESGEELGGNYWSRQLREPAQFASGMENLKREGFDIFVELGPGATLVDLGRSCLGEEGRMWAPSLTKGRKDWEQLQENLGRLWGAGVEVKWRKVAGGRRRKLVGMPSYPFQRQRYWLKSGESNKRRTGRLEPQDSRNLAQSNVE